MRKIESIFITISLFAAIAVTGRAIWNYSNEYNPKTNDITYFEPTEFGAFLAAQHAIYKNDFGAAEKYSAYLTDTEYPVVQNTKMLAEFLNGKMPENAGTLKNEKSMPAQLIYDAYLIKNNKWKELHNRHKSDESALAAPLRIWSAIANDWRTNTFKFIDKLPTNESWKAFVRGQIYAELGDIDTARKNFMAVAPEFMNINDYLYIMSFYTHHGFDAQAETLKMDFTLRPGGMFMADFENIPDWSIYNGYENALAFSLVQNVSHTQIMMYSDLAMLLLRFAQITAPEFAENNDAINYYLGQYYYNNSGDWQTQFGKIKSDSPFWAFAMLRTAEKTQDISPVQDVLRAKPLFVPAVNYMVGHHIKNGDKRDALRVIERALDNENLNEIGQAFFLKSRAHVHFAFGDMDAAQEDVRAAADILMVDGEILSLQAKIWAAQNRELDNAYDYAMTLVTQNPSDILAWDTLGAVVAAREGPQAALDMLERVGEVSDTCSSLFVQIGDLFAQIGNKPKARAAYQRAIDLADDGLTVVPNVKEKIRKLK